MYTLLFDSRNNYVSLHPENQNTANMPGRKVNKETIFRSAFKTFLSADYGTVSIQDIEDSGDFTRGALFYYAKTKPDIFRLAMEVGLFDRMRNEEELDAFVSQPKTLAEFITFYAEWLEQPIKIIMEAKECSQGEAARVFLHLLSSTKEVMPEFTAHFKASNEKLRSVLLGVLEQARNQRKLPVDTNINQLADEIYLTTWGCYVDAVFTRSRNFDLLRGLQGIIDRYK